VAIGFSVIWGVMNLINLAHGSMVIMGAYITYYLNAGTGIDRFSPSHQRRRAVYFWLPGTEIFDQPRDRGLCFHDLDPDLRAGHVLNEYEFAVVYGRRSLDHASLRWIGYPDRQPSNTVYPLGFSFLR